MSTVYLNGEWLPLEDAKVSVLDRGFTFADGVYEMIPVYGGHILRLEEHLNRLRNSLSEIYIENPHTREAWTQIIGELLERNPGAENRSVYIQVTRGVSDRDHFATDNLRPTVFLLCREIPVRDFSAGVGAITHDDIRWHYGHIKSIALLPSVLLKRIARQTDGSLEAILIRDGQVTEGAASNVFIVRDGEVRTPPTDGTLLPGITRDLLVELLQRNGIPCRETAVPRVDLLSADEIWISSATIGVVPVVRLDGRPVKDGAPGPLWRRVSALYLAFRQSAAPD